MCMNEFLFAFWSPGPAEMLVFAVVALLLYGGNLPEVARSWGKSFAEFRRGLSGIQNELNEVIYSEPVESSHKQLAYDADFSRDDSRLADGYDDSDDEQVDESEIQTEQFPHDQCVQDLEEQDTEAKPDTDDSDQTVKGVSADTVVIEPNENDSNRQS